jgi:perosamine synthetase
MESAQARQSIPWSKPGVGVEELAEITAAFDTGWLTMGPRVRQFETVMAKRLNVKHAIAVTNGTIAIDLALMAMGIQPGDEVIVPSFTYFATASAVNRVGAVPVFVDIEEETLGLDPRLLAAAVTPRTRAAIFIDYGGMAAQIDALKAEAARLDLMLLQDAAQSLGAVYKGAAMGAQTEISTMSFHMAKVMACVEGGMIFTHRDDYADELRILRNQGESGKYLHSHLGPNARMTDISAAIGLAQERKLDAYIESRLRVMSAYDRHFTGANTITLLPPPQLHCKHAGFIYGIRVRNQSEVISALKADGIETRVLYPMAVYEQEVYRSGRATYRATCSPVAKQLAREVINLPIFPELSGPEIGRIAAVVLANAT